MENADLATPRVEDGTEQSARNSTFKTQNSTLWEPLAIWLGLRVGLSLLALLAGLYIPSRLPGGTAPYHPPPLPALWARLLGVWSRWDGQRYLQIATAGYHSGDGTTAFLPLYP